MKIMMQALITLLALLAGGAAAQWANPHPEEAKIRYPRGEAPFHVRVRSYARHLDFLFERGMQSAMQNELREIGVDAAELDAIYLLFSDYRERREQVRVEAREQECIPLLRGDAVTNEQAREVMARLYGDAWEEAFAEQVLEEVGLRLGAAIAEKVRQRIIVQGEPIEFTKSDFVKEIEIGRGGLFLSHMMLECGTHPDYPKR